MFKLLYVANQQEHMFLCRTKIEALEKVKSFFTDKRRNKPIAFELSKDKKIIIDAEGFENLEESYQFFQTNKAYGQEFNGSDKYYDLEFN